MGMDFEARCVESARKKHICFACLGEIPVGGTYIVYPCAGEDGHFKSVKFCPVCGYLLTQKDGANARTIREGEFSETLIPNCLRKKRNAFLRDHETALREAGMDNPAPTAAVPRRIGRIVVSREVFRRRVFPATPAWMMISPPLGNCSGVIFLRRRKKTRRRNTSRETTIRPMRRGTAAVGAGLSIPASRSAVS